MNYVSKLHPPGLFAESLINNSKFCRNSYICAHCLHRHGVIRSNAQELSTYVSALKLMLKRKENLKKTESSTNAKLFNKLKWSKKSKAYITELLKVTPCRSLSTKMTIQQIKPSEITAFAEQPGLTFSKEIFHNTKNFRNVLTTSYSSAENFNKICLNKDNVATKSKLTAKVQTKLFSTKLISKKEIKNHLQSNLINEPRLNLHELVVKTNIQPAKKLRTKSQEISKINKLLSVNAIKVLPFKEVEVISAHKKQNTTKKLPEFKQLIKPKNGEMQNNLLNAQTTVETDADILNFLNQRPLLVESKESEKTEGSYIKERILLPFNLDYSPNYTSYWFLQSYLDVCITSQNLKKALMMFQRCRCNSSWKLALKENKNIVAIYNTLLKAYSEKKNWTVVKIITKWMEMDKIKLNSESFAHILCSLGNSNDKNLQNDEVHKTEIIKVIQKLISNNISLNDIFAKTTLTKEKTEKILGLFRKVLPSFDIEPTTIKLNSDCQLLKNLHAGQNMLQPAMDNNLSHEVMEKLVEEQLMLERNFFVQVKAVFKADCTDKQKKEVEALRASWRKQVHNGFLRKLKLTEESESSKKFNISTYLNSLPAETFVNIMMQLVEELVEYSGGYSPSTQLFYKTLGEKINQCYQVQKKIVTGDLDKTEKLYKKFTCWYLDPCGPARNTRQEWQMLSQDSNGRCQVDTRAVKWPTEVLNKLGKYLYEIIINEVKFTPYKRGFADSPIPVFYSILRNNGDHSTEEIKCHPIVANLFRKVGFDNLTFPADKVPMVCPPKPWKASDHGGYLLLPTDFVRPSEHISGKVINYTQVPVQQLYATFDSLNALQAVPWIINQDVLDVALEVFENGGSDKLNVPSLPESTPVPTNITAEMSASERFQQYKKARQIVMERKNQYGLWCEALYKLSLANHFRKRVFWLPQNCDFRGRVYPVPPHLNHLGADLFRSLLLFAKGKPLGPKGIDWLKIHIINLTGTHKRKSIKERLEHANVILSDIIDSAENPLTGKKWWTESDEPWQTLAACMEIKRALSSPNPELYVSRFPIHQDGSCNGLQHYAALGRDVVGAKSVNLTPCETPQDVYSVVAEIVEQKRAEDARNGVLIAQVLEGFIERKVVKQTVMTTVYGVTKYGAKLQIAKRLEEIPSFPRAHVKKASEYLSVKTFQSLNQMFCSAKEIQDWFIQCANEICKKNDYVQWISPLGLPVLQSYGKKSRSSKTKRITIVPDLMKQRNAFPPNFVHSLDSSHMMLTALFCEQAGITFAAIHDCFWTHPADVDTLNKICREQFISLHSQEILQDLSDFFTKCYIKREQNPEDERAAKIFDSVPKTGDFSLDQVLNSVYFFS